MGPFVPRFLFFEALSPVVLSSVYVGWWTKNVGYSIVTKNVKINQPFFIIKHCVI